MDAGRHPLLRFLTTSCFTDDNPVNPQLTDTIDDFWDMPGNEGDSAVVAALKSIKNIVDLKPFMNVHLGQAYYFNYIQLVDHNNPSMGTFKQQVVLTFADSIELKVHDREDVKKIINNLKHIPDLKEISEIM